jgi:hypothetical protein
VRVHGQIVHRQQSCIFWEVASHPVILAGSGYIANLLAEVVPEELGSALAGH